MWISWLIACGGPEPADSGAPEVRPPNVLVVLLDDVGNDKIPAYGEHPKPAITPNIDALAAEGVLFRNTWAAATCSPARGALLTGRYGRRYGLGQADTAYTGDYEVPLDEWLVPEMLDAAPDRWSTSLVGKWHLATYQSPSDVRHPGLQGFDWYHASFSNLNEGTPDGPKETYYDWELDDNGDIVQISDRYATTYQIDDALERITEMPEPWFLYLSLNAAHTPLANPPESLLSGDATQADDSDKGVRYHQTLEAADTELGRLLAQVDLADTVVVLTADNGTPSHGILPPLDPSQGKLSLFEGGVNVPLIVAGPPVAVPGSESGALVHLVDVFPTIAELAGVDLRSATRPDGSPLVLDGRSLLPMLADPAAAGRAVVYAEDFGPNGSRTPDHDQRTVRDARFKMIVSPLVGSESLFDLQGRTDDGPELLAAGGLSPEAQAAYTELRAALDTFERELVSDY
ncbi:MAG: sulfatase-like hydrolase/transferase [Myxococcota bacterium]